MKDSWEVLVPNGFNPMYILYSKLRRLKLCLKRLNQAHYSNISEKVAEKRAELHDLQLALQSDPSSATLITDEKRLSVELHDLLLAEERFYKQKSRIQWLKSSDQNTAYFYKVIKMKQSRNTIKFLYTDDNLILDSPHEVNAEALNYFQK